MTKGETPISHHSPEIENLGWRWRSEKEGAQKRRTKEVPKESPTAAAPQDTLLVGIKSIRIQRVREKSRKGGWKVLFFIRFSGRR